MLQTKKNSWLLGVILLLPSCAWFSSDVQKIDTITQAEQELSTATPNTLVVFDMDQTLINPTEQLFNILCLPISCFDLADHAFIRELCANHPVLQSASNDFYNQPAFVSVILEKNAFIPTEQKSIKILQDAQKRGVRVIALTAASTGTLGSIKNMPAQRVHNLQQIGLDFSASFTEKEFEFVNLFTDHKNPPAFYHGVLCASRNPKGLVLKAFFEKINWHPEKILFFDDNKEQCESVAREMKKLNIPTISYWYRAAYQKKIKLDQQVIQCQMDHWTRHKEFLSTPEILGLQPPQKGYYNAIGR